MAEQQPWVWVTGASSGIGEAVALRLLREGWLVIVSARTKAKLQSMVERHPGRCYALPLDLTDAEALEKAKADLQDITGHLDALVLNAGNCEYIDVKHFDSGAFKRVMDINLLGAARSLELALPLLRRARRKPHIVGVGSMVTVLPLTRSEAYGASKAAFEYLMESLRVDLGSEGMDITLVRPGFVKTPLTDKNDFEMPFLVPVDKAAGHIVCAMATRKKRVQFPWQLVWIMRLIDCLPLGWKTRLLQKMVKS